MPCTLELQPAVLSPEDARDRTRLGATPVGDGTSFVVVAPHASAVDLCLLQTDGAGAVVSERRVGMHGPQRGAWGAHVSGVGPGQRYAYRVHGEWNPSEGLLANPRKLTLDPYARALEGAPVLGPEIFAHEVDADYNPLYVPFTPWTRPGTWPSAWSRAPPSRWSPGRRCPRSAPSSTRPTSRG